MSYLLAVNEYCLLSAAFGGANGYQKGSRTIQRNILFLSELADILHIVRASLRRTLVSLKNHVRCLDRDPNSPSHELDRPPPTTQTTATTPLAHSDRKLFTGFATAARIACT